MAAHLLRLRIAQLAAPFRQGRRAALWTGGALLVAIAVVIVSIGGIRLLAGADASTAHVVSVIIASVLVAAFFFAPFVAGKPDPLDPRALATVPVVSVVVVAPVLVICGLLSAPALALIAVDLAVASVWMAHGAETGTVALAVTLHVVTCVTAARIGYAAASRSLDAHRLREAVILTAIAASAVVIPAGIYALTQSWAAGAPILAGEVVDVLILTPLGAAAGIVVGGETATAPTIVAFVTVLTVLVIWFIRVQRAVSTLPRERAQRRGHLGWFGVLPGTAFGAIGARGLFYWATDVRYLANVAIVPLAGLLPVIPLMLAGTPTSIVAIIPLPIVAAFLGWIAHNDLAYDSEAVWIHVVTGVRGFSDRLGRLVPVLVITLPMLALTVALTAAVSDRWDALPAFIGVALALFFGGLGLSSVSSALAPYPVARPGDSPFRQPQRLGPRGAAAPAIVLLLTIAVGTPTMIRAAESYFSRAARPDDALLSGVITGGVVLVAGVLLGGVIFDRRAHRIMELATRTG
ncbi:hypothetical protein [Microbacterium amylolyticum]|uniref:ABC-2 type transport system permease protein n=1 Tax=Microbacterium amylolyticum TaxID=936337 RepID=A0ABS4ZKH9_9MICO|nr:hypothetical protein [Microbacterium amylolyticum]MBP2437801.1 ABC-2 type transport system permease protein [Microbacterium amylolyticum]